MKVSIENLRDWKDNDAFCCFASSAGKNGLIELGVNGNGHFQVRVGKRSVMNTPVTEQAINKFESLTNAK